MPRGTRIALALVLLAALARSVAWIAAMPPWQGPDEPDRYAYVERLANGDFPPLQLGQDTRFSAALASSIQATGLEQFRSRSGNRPFTPALRAALGEEAPDQSQDGVGAATANPYPPGYFAAVLPLYELPFLHTATARLYAIRVGSAIMTLIAIAMTFLALRIATGRDRLALGGAYLLSLEPMLSQASAIANADVFLTMATAGFLYACLRFREGARRGWTGVLVWGVLVCLAKPTGPWAAVALGAPLVLWPRIQQLRRSSRIAVAAGTVLALVVSAGVLYRPSVRSLDPVTSVRYSLSYLWQFYLPRLPFMGADPFQGPLYGGNPPVWSIWIVTGVGFFGWLTGALPEWCYQLAAVSILAAVAAAIWFRFSGRGVSGPRPVAAACLAGCAIYVLCLHAAEATSLLTGAGAIMQGRYLLPALPFALVALLQAFARASVRRGELALLALCAVWTLIQVESLERVVWLYAT